MDTTRRDSGLFVSREKEKMSEKHGIAKTSKRNETICKKLSSMIAREDDESDELTIVKDRNDRTDSRSCCVCDRPDACIC